MVQALLPVAREGQSCRSLGANGLVPLEQACRQGIRRIRKSERDLSLPRANTLRPPDTNVPDGLRQLKIDSWNVRKNVGAFWSSRVERRDTYSESYENSETMLMMKMMVIGLFGRAMESFAFWINNMRGIGEVLRWTRSQKRGRAGSVCLHPRLCAKSR